MAVLDLARRRPIVSFVIGAVVMFVIAGVAGEARMQRERAEQERTQADNVRRSDAAAAAADAASRRVAAALAEPIFRERREFLNRLVDRGIFLRVDLDRSVPRIWVSSAFYALDFQLKEKMVSVVFAQCKARDDSCMVVTLHDQRSGKNVGRYSLSEGGLVMD